MWQGQLSEKVGCGVHIINLLVIITVPAAIVLHIHPSPCEYIFHTNVCFIQLICSKKGKILSVSLLSFRHLKLAYILLQFVSKNIMMTPARVLMACSGSGKIQLSYTCISVHNEVILIKMGLWFFIHWWIKKFNFLCAVFSSPALAVCIIAFLKLISYKQVNKWCRTHRVGRDARIKRSRRKSASYGKHSHRTLKNTFQIR